jgi:hypothetical protein
MMADFADSKPDCKAHVKSQIASLKHKLTVAFRLRYSRSKLDWQIYLPAQQCRHTCLVDHTKLHHLDNALGCHHSIRK